MNKSCLEPGCPNERWSGPNGDKPNFFGRCEEHQRELWRKQALKRREAKTDGKPRRRGRKPSNGGGITPPEQPVPPAPPMPIQRTQPPGRKPVKVLVLDYHTRHMTHIEGHVVLETGMPDDSLAAELLLEGYEDYFVVQRGESELPLMMAYEGR